MNYQTTKFADIIKWCDENNQLEWLESYITTEIEKPIYPKKKTKAGKEVVDTKAKAIGTKKALPTANDVKKAFFTKFMPEKLPKGSKAKKPSLLDKLNAYKKKNNIQ